MEKSKQKQAYSNYSDYADKIKTSWTIANQIKTHSGHHRQNESQSGTWADVQPQTVREYCTREKKN